uniref:Uncharacterized protein n=1 Tax=Zea mays TaxID=4577 RepID=A0A804M3H0_MAIZE
MRRNGRVAPLLAHGVLHSASLPLPPVRRLPVAASAAPSGAAAAATERKRFRERYGLNPDDFEEDAEEDPREESRDRRSRGDSSSLGEGSKLWKLQLLQRSLH